MSQSVGFLGYLCSAYPRILMLHAFLWLGAVLNTLSFVFVDLPSGAEVVVAMNYVGLAVLLLGSGSVLLVCRDEWTWSRDR